MLNTPVLMKHWLRAVLTGHSRRCTAAADDSHHVWQSPCGRGENLRVCGSVEKAHQRGGEWPHTINCTITLCCISDSSLRHTSTTGDVCMLTQLLGLFRKFWSRHILLSLRFSVKQTLLPADDKNNSLMKRLLLKTRRLQGTKTQTTRKGSKQLDLDLRLQSDKILLAPVEVAVVEL